MHKIFRELNRYVDEGILVGYSAAIVSTNNVTSNQYGYRDIQGNPLQDNDLYDIASLTKLFITTRILQLLETNRITLNTSVNSILPLFMNNEITIEHLLMHRSGLAPSHSGRFTMSKEEMIESLMNMDELINPINSTMVYSCLNFILLGLIIETLDQMSLDKSIDHYVSKPLDLKDTQFKPFDIYRCLPTEIDRPIGFVHDETCRRFGGVAGNAGLFSSLNDLVKFSRVYLQPGLLSISTLNLLHETNCDSRSLGWNRHSFKESSYLYHTGFTGPSILINHDNNSTLIILTHRIHPTRDNETYLKKRLELFDIFLNQS